VPVGLIGVEWPGQADGGLRHKQTFAAPMTNDLVWVDSRHAGGVRKGGPTTDFGTDRVKTGSQQNARQFLSRRAGGWTLLITSGPKMIGGGPPPPLMSE
jgi:hypothetical protein